MVSFKVKPISKKEKTWINSLLGKHWGSNQIVSRGKISKADELPGFIAFIKNKPVGLITYKISDYECEIITLDSLQEKNGIGTKLIQLVLEKAKTKKIKRVWLITTNDNLSALHFYQKRGFELVCIYKNAVNEARKIKPQIPQIGIDNIPLKDEIELEFNL